jgi:hypothetical protein
VSHENVGIAVNTGVVGVADARRRNYLALGLAVKQMFKYHMDIDFAVAFSVTLGNRIVREASSVNEC